MATTTTNFNLQKPTVGADTDVWGDMLNANMDKLDATAVRRSQNLADLADKAAAFSEIKQSASTTATGVVELATDAETQAGTDTARAVTPAALASRTATESRPGLIERASQAEAEAGTDNYRAMTPERTKQQLTQLAEQATGYPRVQVPTRERLTGSGNWTVPDGVTRIRVWLVGAGGGGGGGASSAGDGNGGGGGGGGCFVEEINTSGGTVFPYSCGIGGSGGAVETDGSDGGSTTFGTGRTAYGGGGGSFAFVVSGIGGPGGSGGGTGCPGCPGNTTARTTSLPSGGGSGMFGGGGYPGSQTPNYGGGGAGGNNVISARAGGDGFIIVEY